MDCTPQTPQIQHVWVRGHGNHGAPNPGVVLSWQHSPVHNATASDWIGPRRHLPLRHSTPGPVGRSRTAHPRPRAWAGKLCWLRPVSSMTGQRRHVWVDSAGGQHAGLVLTWRRTHDGSWEAHVAVNLSGTLLVTWTPASALRPITDDRGDNRSV